MTTALAVTTIAMSFSSPSYGFGGVVFDPTQAANMAKQLAEDAKQLGELRNQITELKGIQSSMTGNSSYTSSMLPQISTLKNNVMQLTPSMAGISGGGGNTKDLSHMLDSVFVPDSQMPREISAPVRKDYWQKSLKSALESSENLLGKSGDELNTMSQLAGQIDRTKNIKESQDLTNRLFIESIGLQQQMVILLAQLTRAEASAKYAGVYSDTKGQMGKTTHLQEMENLYGKSTAVPNFGNMSSGNRMSEDMKSW